MVRRITRRAWVVLALSLSGGVQCDGRRACVFVEWRPFLWDAPTAALPGAWCRDTRAGGGRP
jgi:hypothetical protein